ncbi:MAG: hypothetical protein ACTTKL_03990 [Treponema sp.]
MNLLTSSANPSILSLFFLAKSFTSCTARLIYLTPAAISFIRRLHLLSVKVIIGFAVCPSLPQANLLRSSSVRLPCTSHVKQSVIGKYNFPRRHIKNAAGKRIFPTAKVPITNYQLYFELSNFLRQPFNTVFIFPRQVIHFLYGAIELPNACRHLLQTAFAERESYY